MRPAEADAIDRVLAVRWFLLWPSLPTSVSAPTRGAFAIPGKHLDHPAGVTAVLYRRRAAQHFDAVGGIEVEGRRLTLAIRGQAGMPSAINFRPRTQRPSARRSRAMRSADPARNSGDFAPPAPAPG